MKRTLRSFAFSLTVAIGSFAFYATAQAQQPYGAPLFAVLYGANECNSLTPTTCRIGDLDAIGSATIIIAPNDATTAWVCWGITLENLAPTTAAHIHTGVAGVNGGILVNLSPAAPPAPSDPGAFSGCVSVAVAVANQLRFDPTRFYVNVHNAAFPGGAVRGQLH